MLSRSLMRAHTRFNRLDHHGIASGKVTALFQGEIRPSRPLPAMPEVSELSVGWWSRIASSTDERGPTRQRVLMTDPVPPETSGRLCRDLFGNRWRVHVESKRTQLSGSCGDLTTPLEPV